MARGRRPHIDGIFDWLKGKPAGGPPPPAGPKTKFDPRVDYYAILEIRPDASEIDIRAAFRNLARRYHPDRDPSPEAAQMFYAVTEAYRVLSDERARSEYDRARSAAPPPQAPPPRRPPPPPSGEIIVPPPTAPAMPSFFEAFRPPPPPPQVPTAAPPRRAPEMWEVMFGPPEELTKPPPARPSMFDIYTSTPPSYMPPVPPPSAAPRPPPQFYQPIAPPPPRVLPPASPYGLPQPPPAEIFPTPEEMAEFIQSTWPLEAIWEFVREHKTTLEFRQTGMMLVDRFAGDEPGESAEYGASEWFGISKELVDDYKRRGLLASAFWRDVLYPMFEIAGEAFEALKPRDLPGVFHVNTNNVVVDLYYTETVGRRSWK